MSDQATIIPMPAPARQTKAKKAVVKPYLQPAEKAFLSYVAKVFVTQILKP